MLFVGVSYLLFEDSIIEQLSSTKREEAQQNETLVSRGVVGIQVCLHTCNFEIDTKCQVGRTRSACHLSHKIERRLTAGKTRPAAGYADGWMAHVE
jgi:hypothetical protein